MVKAAARTQLIFNPADQALHDIGSWVQQGAEEGGKLSDTFERQDLQPFANEASKAQAVFQDALRNPVGNGENVIKAFWDRQDAVDGLVKSVSTLVAGRDSAATWGKVASGFELASHVGTATAGVLAGIALMVTSQASTTNITTRWQLGYMLGRVCSSRSARSFSLPQLLRGGLRPESLGGWANDNVRCPGWYQVLVRAPEQLQPHAGYTGLQEHLCDAAQSRCSTIDTGSGGRSWS